MAVKETFEKVVKVIGGMVVGLLAFVGAMLQAQQEAHEKELEVERKVAERNFEAEKMIIKRDDIENLRTHAMRIIRESDGSLFSAGYEGRKLLKKEGDLSTEEFNKKLYHFVIEYGL